MNHSTKFRCVLIGETSLIGSVVEMLQRRGHEIIAVISDEPEVNGLPRFSSIGQARQKMALQPDLLFSVANRYLLSAGDISWPRRMALNYHDGPLPRYAGVNAPSWAILHGETGHGITWHQVTTGIDAGDILIQRRFSLRPDETALSLNMLCREQALVALEELLERFEAGDWRATPQDLSLRTRFTQRQRLPGHGIIHWDQTADAICRFVRACQFGPYPNDFGLPKIFLPGEDLLIVERAVTVRMVPEGADPGRVLAASASSCTIAAMDAAVRLEGLMYLSGRRFHVPADLVGYRFPRPETGLLGLLERAERLAAGEEARWLQDLGSIEPPLTLRQLKAERYPEAHGREHSLELPLPAGCTPTAGLARALLALAREAGQTRFTVGLRCDAAIGFSRLLPVSVRLPDGNAAVGPDGVRAGENPAEIVEASLHEMLGRTSFPHDLIRRFPALAGVARCLEQIDVLLCEGAGEANVTDPAFPKKGLVIEADTERLLLHFAADRIDAVAARRTKEAIGLALAAPSALSDPPGPESHEGPRWCHDLVIAHAVRHPEAIAIEMGDDVISYGKLQAGSARIANFLSSRGARAESRVAILLPRCVDYGVCMVGILRAGAAFIPLDPQMPSARLRDIVDDAQPLLLICNRHTRDMARLLDVPLLDLDRDAVQLEILPALGPRRQINADDLAYILYTSGSSGAPKGTMVEHGALSHFMDQDIAAHAIGSDDRILQLCSPAFDASIEEIMSALISGATLMVPPADVPVSARKLLDFCESRRLTVIGIFGAMLGDVVNEMERRGSWPAGVRRATTGGERVASGDVRRWQAFFKGRGLKAPALINVYGLTETTIANILCDLSTTVLYGEETPIGLPLHGNQVRIVTADLQPVPEGQAGELLVGGPQLARAYLKRPSDTAERFLRDPIDGSRWLRTGDAVFRQPDGQLVFHGRLDRQIKLRGLRIEPGEIEKALEGHPDVERAVVIARDDGPARRRLVAYWIETKRAENGGSASADELRAYLAAVLPASMVPEIFVRVACFPLTENGKIDVRSLPAPAILKDADIRTPSAISVIELRLLKLWQEALKRADFGIHHNFFELGGNSLIATTLLARIEEMVGQPLSMATFLLAPTVAEFVSRFRDNSLTLDCGSIVQLQPKGDAIPIYVIHGWGGNVYNFINLARALAPDRPVYGLQAVGLDRSVAHYASVEQIAAHYAAQIRSFQPDGPYHLMGSSAGGWHAFAVAAELLRKGGRIGLLGLIDTGPTAALDWRVSLPEQATDFVRRVSEQLPGILQTDHTQRTGFLKNRARAVYQLVRAFFPPTSDESDNDYFASLHTTYRPPRLPIQVDVFSTRSTLGSKERLWRFYACGGVNLHPVFDSHLDFSRDDLMPELAELLRSLCGKIETGASS